MPQRAKYFFDKLHISTHGINETDFLRKVLLGENEVILEKSNYNWRFIPGEFLEHNSEKFLFGFLVRFKTMKEETVDNEAVQIVESPVKNEVKAKSPFFINLEKEHTIIAYHPVSNITNSQFENIFTEIMREARKDFFIEVDLNPVIRKEEILEAIEEFEKITKLRIELKPTNPTYRIEDDDIVEELENMGAEVEENYRPSRDDGGLDVPEDSLAKRKLRMTTEGFGKSEIEGIREGEKDTVKTTEFREQTTAPSSSSAGPKDILQSLIQRFRRWWG